MTSQQLHEFGTSIIHEVHSLWEQKKKLYPSGYEVFYGPLRFRPTLFLVGVNPGGGKESARLGMEKLAPEDSDMEYITSTGKDGYPLAQRTCPIFQHIGYLETLAKSVKTNLNFFRSKQDSLLPKEDALFCRAHVIRIIEMLQPGALFCEGVTVFDEMRGTLYAKHKLRSCQEYSREGRRKYVSMICDEPALPRLLIGICHLSPTYRRPTSEDCAKIGEHLKIDLDTILGRPR